MLTYTLHCRGVRWQLLLNQIEFSKVDIHVHFPEGAVPKDGPSAGIAVVTALFSLLSGTPVPSHIAMTGEVTLSGAVRPIGGEAQRAIPNPSKQQSSIVVHAHVSLVPVFACTMYMLLLVCACLFPAPAPPLPFTLPIPFPLPLSLSPRFLSHAPLLPRSLPFFLSPTLLLLHHLRML